MYKNKSFSLIAWKSRKIKRVIKSTLASETLAMEQALEACFMIKSFICEIMNRQVSEEFLPIKCYVDHKSLIDSIIFHQNFYREKVRQMIAKKKVTSVEWCKSELQLADCLTKGTTNCMILLNVLKGNITLLE